MSLPTPTKAPHIAERDALVAEARKSNFELLAYTRMLAMLLNLREPDLLPPDPTATADGWCAFTPTPGPSFAEYAETPAAALLALAEVLRVEATERIDMLQRTLEDLRQYKESL